MPKGLSIIIPCFNCEATVEAAVASCFTQGLEDSFEIVMVDDASTDTTPQILARFAKKHPHIRVITHSENRGGGAARNTAVAHAAYGVIFCLDSDDLLPPDTLSTMLTYLHEKKYDGVGVSLSTKFKGTNTRAIAFQNHFGFVDTPIPFDALIERGDTMLSLYSTFMFTKDAFALTGGYPTTHGFDTQGFAWRFLAQGLTAATCPHTEYLHRINAGESYYMREYHSGKINHNWFAVCEEFLFLFSTETQRMILTHDLNDHVHLLWDTLRTRKDIFRTDFSQYIIPGSRDAYAKSILAGDNTTPYDFYWMGTYTTKKQGYTKAAEWFLKALVAGLDVTHVYDKLLTATAQINTIAPEDIRARIQALHAYEAQGAHMPLLKRIVRKIRRTLSP